MHPLKKLTDALRALPVEDRGLVGVELRIPMPTPNDKDFETIMNLMMGEKK